VTKNENINSEVSKDIWNSKPNILSHSKVRQFIRTFCYFGLAVQGKIWEPIFTNMKEKNFRQKTFFWKSRPWKKSL
jgi:hypothetical protein